MVKNAENLGDYERLSPHVVKMANAMNGSYDLEQALAKARSEVAEHETSSESQLFSSLQALVESGVSGDELLVNYNEIIRSNSDVKRTEVFEEMLLLGARLVPGEVVRIDGEVMTIAAPDDDTEEFAPAPLLVVPDHFRRGVTYELVWTVPVVGKEDTVLINTRTTVGRVDIKEELDFAHRGGIPQQSLSLLRRAEDYRAIGEPEDAEKYKGRAVGVALKELRRVNEHTGFLERDVADSFEVLDSTGALDRFLEEISLEIAQDTVESVKINAGRYSLLHNFLAYRMVKRGECDRVWRANVNFDEIIGLWLVLKARGKALLELQREQNLG